jgi:hypothetical protein
MNVDESKCDSRRSTDRINTTGKRPVIVLNDAADEISNIISAQHSRGRFEHPFGHSPPNPHGEALRIASFSG